LFSPVGYLKADGSFRLLAFLLTFLKVSSSGSGKLASTKTYCKIKPGVHISIRR